MVISIDYDNHRALAIVIQQREPHCPFKLPFY